MSSKAQSYVLVQCAAARRRAERRRSSSSIRASLLRNPVIFVTEVVAALVTVLWLRDLFAP